MRALTVIVCVCFGCASPDLELVAEEQAMWNGDGEDPDGEVIEVGGEAPFDPNWEGPGQGAPGNQGEPSGGGGGGGGNGGGGEPSGGGGTGGPGDQPERKQCSRDQGLDQCLDCCFYNHDKVDGWVCRKIKGDSKRQQAKREKCWKKAVEEQSRCQVEDCGRDRPIITASGAP